MTKLGSYPDYVDSGIEWLGAMPAEWSIRALRYLATIETGSKDTADSEPDGEYPFIVRSPTPLRISTFSYNEEAILTAGDGDVGEIFHHMNGKFDVHQRVYVLREFREVAPRFLYYYFSSKFINVVAYGGAQTTVSSLRRPMFTSFPVAVPGMKAQLAIASYLDRETAEIDAFITDQEELIGLLTERRAATISHAVTKGLDPNVPMKDSGVEWLGEVPEHWSVNRLSRCVRINEGQVDPEIEPFVDMVLIAPNHIKAKTGRSGGYETAREQGAESGKYYVRRGQVIYSKIRPNLAKVIVAPFDCLCSADMYGLEAMTGLDNEYLRWMMLSESFTDYAIDQSARVAMPKLNHETLGAAPVWYPKLSEQSAIVAHLDHETTELDAAIADAREAISLSRERRSALISAAVTGKIDVRGHGAVT